MKTKILFITLLLLIVGCSKPVEDSTLINKDGLMYLPDSDSPYSGEVFTNYDTGEKEYQGTYENGLLIEYSYLNKDGTVKEPVNGETLIDRNGLFYEVNGQKPYTGDVFELYKDGSRKSSGTLKGGKNNGLSTGWYENGQKEGETTFKNGELDGLTTVWYENGQKMVEGTYKNGKKEGVHTGWNENGQKMKEGTYKDGKEDGLWTDYENGQKTVERTYKDGEKNGLWTEWYYNGQKKREGTYKDGEYFLSNSWDKNGDIILKNGNGLITSWYEDGQKEEETYKDGEKIKVTRWYDNGQKGFERTYKDGKLDGLWTVWYDNGKKEEEGTYRGGLRVGNWTTYWWVGRKKEVTFYNEDGYVKEVKDCDKEDCN